MGFWLKKFVSFWLMPLPFCLTLLVAGVASDRAGRRRRSRVLILTATALLLLLSNKWVSAELVRPLEERYPGIPELAAGQPLPAGLAGCRYVVILGGGHSDMPGAAATNKLSTSALSRLVEGVRVLRHLPDARLIVSGPAEGPNPSHAAVLEAAAASLGIDPARVTRIERAQDTEEEAAAVKAIVGSARIVLVTSAWHMPRAAALFRHAGVDLVPCPADYLAKTNADFRWNDLTWDAESLDRSTAAVHERLGLWWLEIRGRI
jgi:uncharacterized SAM-binding protein YcdF (DUF218 family)